MIKKVLLLANRDFVIYNFRFELIKKLVEEKYEVAICLPYGPKVEIMTDTGAEFIPLKIEGRGKNPLKDLILMRDLKMIYGEYKPDIILIYTTKADIYGGIVAGKLRMPYLLNVSGLGTAVGENGILQKLMIYLYKQAVKNAACVFFQNKENMEFFHNNRIACRKEKLIPGSGVNVEHWKYLEYPSEKEGIHFLFIARIIKQKGIEEYLEIAKEIKKKYSNTFFHIMGPCDDNYGDVLKHLESEGIIQYHGMVQDTREYLKIAHCTIHPSFYPEGISNVCLESAASGRPIITTDNPGCRDTVDDFVTGYIVKENNPKSFVREVEHFLHLPWEQKKIMGIKGREKVEKEFNRDLVIDAYMEEIEKVCDAPIRILQMISTLEMGGSQSMILNLYRAINRQKVQFDFIIDHDDRDPELRKEIETLGGKIFLLPTFKGKNIKAVRSAWENFFCDHEEYKVLHTHSRSYASVYIPIAKRHGLITIAHSHSTSNGKKLSAIVKNIMQLPLRHQADYMFACSIEAGKWLFGKSVLKKNNFRVIPNAIDASKFAFNQMTRQQVRNELGLKDCVVIGHVGRLMAPKNHMFLLKVFETFVRDNPDAMLLLVGDGDLRGQIEKEVDNIKLRENVMILGSRADAKRLYQAMDVFVFPSLWEGLGIAVIEAQASGLPCIVSNNVPKRVDVGAGLVNFLSLGSPVQKWADSIKKVERKNTSEYVITAGYDISETSKELQEFYINLVNGE